MCKSSEEFVTFLFIPCILNNNCLLYTNICTSLVPVYTAPHHTHTHTHTHSHTPHTHTPHTHTYTPNEPHTRHTHTHTTNTYHTHTHTHTHHTHTHTHTHTHVPIPAATRSKAELPNMRPSSTWIFSVTQFNKHKLVGQRNTTGNFNSWENVQKPQLTTSKTAHSKPVFLGVLSSLVRPTILSFCGLKLASPGLRRGSTAAHLLGLRVRIPLVALMSILCNHCVLSGRDFCYGLIIHPEEFYRAWCF